LEWHITDIGTVNETEQIQQGHRGHNVEIDFAPQPCFGPLVESDQGDAISGNRR
jgi:hypothetical protein